MSLTERATGAGASIGLVQVVVIASSWTMAAGPPGHRATTIAYQTCDQGGGRCGLFLIGADGANPRAITGVPGDTMPAWSPDGSRIAFASADRVAGTYSYWRSTQAMWLRWLQVQGMNAHPVWSPDDGRSHSYPIAMACGPSLRHRCGDRADATVGWVAGAHCRIGFERS